MNQQNFIDKVIGNPWIDRTSSFDSCDCYGLVMLYYKHVLGIELPTINGYDKGQCDTAQGWQSGIYRWRQLDKPIGHGLLFTCYKGGQPSHVGVTIGPTKVLHSRGNASHSGKVEIHSIRAIKAIYGNMTYHEFIG
jgi:cell wall-associated NlpC family hydrolase